MRESAGRNGLQCPKAGAARCRASGSGARGMPSLTLKTMMQPTSRIAKKLFSASFAAWSPMPSNVFASAFSENQNLQR